MHPALIKAELEIADTTQRDVADQCKCSASLVNDVIHGNRRSKRVENRISLITRKTLAELWPERYGPNAPKVRRRRASARAVMGAPQALAR